MYLTCNVTGDAGEVTVRDAVDVRSDLCARFRRLSRAANRNTRARNAGSFTCTNGVSLLRILQIHVKLKVDCT